MCAFFYRIFFCYLRKEYLLSVDCVLGYVVGGIVDGREFIVLWRKGVNIRKIVDSD